MTDTPAEQPAAPAAETPAPAEAPAAAPEAAPAPAAAAPAQPAPDAAPAAPAGGSKLADAIRPGYAFEGAALELGGLMADADTLTDVHIRIPPRPGR